MVDDQRHIISMHGKVAIVAGSPAAVPLVRHGARVDVLDQSIEWARATQQLIDPTTKSLVLQCDVSDNAQCEAAVRRVTNSWGRIDSLFSNVGVMSPPGNVEDADLAAWDQGLRINLTSMMLIDGSPCHTADADLRGRLGDQHLIQRGVGGRLPRPPLPTTKGAVAQLTRAMAAQQGHEGNHVNCVAPGMPYTPMVATRGMTLEQREGRRQLSLLRAEGTGWDIGYAVLNLASDEARYVTGAILPVDAGATSGLSTLHCGPAPGSGTLASEHAAHE